MDDYLHFIILIRATLGGILFCCVPHVSHLGLFSMWCGLFDMVSCLRASDFEANYICICEPYIFHCRSKKKIFFQVVVNRCVVEHNVSLSLS